MIKIHRPDIPLYYFLRPDTFPKKETAGLEDEAEVIVSSHQSSLRHYPHKLCVYADYLNFINKS